MNPQITPEEQTRGAWLVVAGAMCISFAPVFVKLAHGAGVGVSAIGVWRLTLASVCFLALTWRQAPTLYHRVRHGGGWILGLAGFFFAIDLYVWHRSIVWIGAGIATILGNTQVFWSAAIGHFLLGERTGRRLLIAAVLAFAGVVLLSGVLSGAALHSAERMGIAFGLATGVAYAAYLSTLKLSSRRAPKQSRGTELNQALVVLACVSLVGAALLAIAAVVEGEELVPPPGRGWLYLALLAVVVQVAGWLLIYQGIARLRTARAALLLLLQPTFATIWGALLFGEALTPLQLVGALLTLGAIYAAHS